MIKMTGLYINIDDFLDENIMGKCLKNLSDDNT